MIEPKIQCLNTKKWLTLIEAVGPWYSFGVMLPCSPFACYILLWFYEIALPLSYLSTRSSLLVDFSGFFKFRMCSSFTLYRLFTFVSPPPTFPKPSSWGPTVECTNSPGHAWIERDGPNKAPWCGTPLGGSSYLAICCCFFEYGCWMFEYVWYCMFGGFLNTFGFLADVSSFYWIHGWMLTLSVVFCCPSPLNFWCKNLVGLDETSEEKWRIHDFSMDFACFSMVVPWFFP